MLIELPCFPERHFEPTSYGLLLLLGGLRSRLFKHPLLDPLVCLVSRGKVSRVELRLPVVLDDLLVEAATFVLVSDRNEQVLFIQLH